MLVVFSPIFMADAKITFVYSFAAPLKNANSRTIFSKHVERNIYNCIEVFNIA